MRRRDFITFLSGATTWVAAARAQGPRRVIGILGSTSYGAFPGAEAAFIQGLKNTGFLEGDNISIEWRWVEGQYNRLPSLVERMAKTQRVSDRRLRCPRGICRRVADRHVVDHVLPQWRYLLELPLDELHTKRAILGYRSMARDERFPIASLGQGSENRYFPALSRWFSLF